jgi:Kef-type K+ transport system membrane component KefB
MYIAFCLTTATLTVKLGISAELGAFMAGVMLSATEQQEQVVTLMEPTAHFFLALFISSTGLVISPTFLLHHLPVLASGVVVLIVVKTLLVSRKGGRV